MHLIATFERDAGRVAETRRFVEAALEQSGAGPPDDVVLVTSELVTNAVRHGAGLIELHLDIRSDTVHLEVHDEGGSPPTLSTPMPGAEAHSGRGIPIVDRLATSWGSRVDARGHTLVWADLPVAIVN